MIIHFHFLNIYHLYILLYYLPFTLPDHLATSFAMKRIHLSDPRQVVVSNAQMVLTVVQFAEFLRTNVAGMTASGVRTFISGVRFVRISVSGVGDDVVTELLLSGHRLLANVAEEI